MPPLPTATATPAAGPAAGAQAPGRDGEARAHRDFIASMQHELRTPASAVTGYARAMLEDLEPGSEAAEDMGAVLEVSQSLTEIIDRFLSVAAADDGGLEGRVRRFRHDVASSLHALDGYTELMLDGAAQPTPPDLHRVAAASRRLRAAVDQIGAVLSGQGRRDAGGQDAALVRDAMRSLRALPARSMDADQEGRILVVEDDEPNRLLLVRQIERFGFQPEQAPDGREALRWLRENPVDAVLLDIIMPHMNGYQVLAAMKADAELKHIPVVVISAFDDMDSITRCIEMGADDYLPKRFQPAMLRARLGACLERKRLRDLERSYLAEIDRERKKSDSLLLNVLPAPTAERLKAGEGLIADAFDDVTVLFADLEGFTRFAAERAAGDVVRHLNAVFHRFDAITERHGLEKIKTIGDEYMLAGGLPLPCADHAQAVVEAALDMLDAMREFGADSPALRIGVHSGPVVAGVIGHSKFAYDLWGDTVNVANRLQSHGVAGRIQLSADTWERLPREHYAAAARGTLELKGHAPVQGYLLEPRR